MKTVSIDEARVDLSRLVRKALSGEEVVIVEDSERRVRLAPVEAAPRSRRRFGTAAGKIRIRPEFDEPLDDFIGYR